MPRDYKKLNTYVIFDFETTGLDKSNGLHSQRCAATEIALIAIHPVTFERIVAYDNIIKPYDEKLEWQEPASKLTGLTKSVCEKQGVALKQIVSDLCEFFTEANIHNSKIAKPVLIAHNGDFDKQFLQDIFRRENIDLSKYVAGTVDHFGNFQPHILDTIDIAKQIEGHETDTDTKFNLEACCTRKGVDLYDGHRAMNDVESLTELVKIYLTIMRSGGTQVINSEGKIMSHRIKYEW